ncbi:MAG: hypothetical protein KAR05_12080 [Candidatus Omnitrophica bacterium]|nr:hypothetical protein [Candidatus Omnitrophota bacterium]
MAKGYPTEKLLRKVIDDLSDFLPYLVLVGGWIPYLYQKHVWPQELTGRDSGIGSAQSSTPLTTTDMDFGVTLVSYPGEESIADRVRKLGYSERHVSMDRLVPFVPIAKGKEENEKAEVEFITILNPPKHVHEKLVGKEIKMSNIKYFEILLENARKIQFFSQELQIPTEEVFVFHKLLTFVLRENEDKKRKDLYYVYFMLRFCPDKIKLVNSVRDLIQSRKEGKKVLHNIKTFFAHKDDKGPVAIERENGTDYFISNIRQDAFERITQLI